MPKIDEVIPAEEALKLVAGRAGEQKPQPPVLAGFVCKACGTLLADRAGTPATGDPSDAGPCCATNALRVDLATAVVDAQGKVVRATHLE